MAKIETTLIQQSETKPKEWRRYIDDILSLWDNDKKDVDQFTEQANKIPPAIKFTAKISDNEKKRKKSKACHSLTLSKFALKVVDCNKRDAWALGTSTLIST